MIPLKIEIPPIFNHCLSILGLLSCILFRGAGWLFPSGAQLHTSCERIFNTVTAFCNHLGFRCTPKVNNLRAAVKADLWRQNHRLVSKILPSFKNKWSLNLYCYHQKKKKNARFLIEILRCSLGHRRNKPLYGIPFFSTETKQVEFQCLYLWANYYNFLSFKISLLFDTLNINNSRHACFGSTWLWPVNHFAIIHTKKQR